MSTPNKIDSIVGDPRVHAILAAASFNGLIWLTPDGKRYPILQRIAELYPTASRSLRQHVVRRLSGRERKPVKRTASPPKRADVARVSRLPKPPKCRARVKLAIATAAPQITLPPIKEVEHRAQKRTSFSFLGPDGFTGYSFDSFGEARQAREALRPEYTQAEIFNQVKRAPGRPCGSDE